MRPITSLRKIVKFNDLGSAVMRLRQDGLSVALTGGHFDILHVGHVEFLELSHGYADRLAVYVHNDRSSKEIKGSTRPIIPAFERARSIAALETVDMVSILPRSITDRDIELQDIAILESVRPDLFVCVAGPGISEREERIRDTGVPSIALPEQSVLWSTTRLERDLLSSGQETTNAELAYVAAPLEISAANPWEAHLLSLARNVASSSPCILRKVGAVVANSDSVVSVAANSPPALGHPCWCVDCPGMPDPGPDHQACLSTHAEARALLEAARSVDSCARIMAVTSAPCLQCAKLMLESGITRVVYAEEYTLSAGRIYLRQSGVSISRYVDPGD